MEIFTYIAIALILSIASYVLAQVLIQVASDAWGSVTQKFTAIKRSRARRH